MNCRICNNYMSELDTCKFCHFEYDEDYNPFRRDDWDILNLDLEEEWTHIQIADRLKYKGIEFLMVDIWTDDNMAWIIGCRESDSTVADALNIHKECIYNDSEHSLMILNLFQEKYIRGVLDDNH